MSLADDARCQSMKAFLSVHALTVGVLQMTIFGRSFCGAASPCLQLALQGLLRGMIWCGLTLVAALG